MVSIVRILSWAQLALFISLFLAACGTEQPGGERGTAGSGGSGGAPQGSIRSDDFASGSLDGELWTIVDPRGDGTVEVVGGGTSAAQLRLSVPEGVSHNAWDENMSLRVMQSADDGDFELEARFQSEPTERFQSQGLLVEQDPGTFVRFDVYSDGTSLIIFSATFDESVPKTPISEPIASAPEIFLRLGRLGDEWTARYSYDGLTWTTAGTFTHALTVGSVGVFASNHDPSPAFTAVVDYFFETSTPIDPEDGANCSPTDQFTVTTATSGPGSLERSPDKSSYACGEGLTLTAQAARGSSFLGWSGAASGTQNPLTLTVDADMSLTANFEPDTSPPQITVLTPATATESATLSWLTDEPSTGVIAYGESAAYELGSLSSATLATSHSVVIPGLTENKLYHFRITAEDALDNAASTPDATFTTRASGPSGPVVEVWHGAHQVFGTGGEPQRWVNVLGNVRDPDGLGSLTYTLNGGPEQFLNKGTNGQRLQNEGDFNVEIAYADLVPGLNEVIIHAVDGIGLATDETVQVEYVVDPAPSTALSIDWSTVTDASDVVQVVDGNWVRVPGGMRIVELGYDRIVAMGDIDWTDYEAEVEITLNTPVDPSSNDVGCVVGLATRWTGHFDWFGGQPRVGWNPLGALINYMWLEDGSFDGLAYWQSEGQLTFPGGPTPAPAVGVPYIYKMRTETLPSGNVQFRFKMWPSGQTEPNHWTINYTSHESPSNGSLIVVTHYADITIGNVTVVPLDD